jgi:phospholipid transport system transporter-binding protein
MAQIQELAKRPDHIELVVKGDIDFQTVVIISAQGDKWLRYAAQQQVVVTLDFSQVVSANSAGLALLTNWARVAHQRNVVLRYRNIPDKLYTLAHELGLIAVLPVEGGGDK